VGNQHEYEHEHGHEHDAARLLVPGSRVRLLRRGNVDTYNRSVDDLVMQESQGSQIVLQPGIQVSALAYTITSLQIPQTPTTSRRSAPMSWD
jgi:hypothetical protein